MLHFDAVTLKQLRALATVLSEGGVTAAANRLGLTPPAISTQLRTLEANIGGPVLHRAEGGRMTPTAEGLELLAAARRITAALDDCRRHINALRSGLQGLVTLGVVSTGKYFAPRIVALARRLLPGIEIVLRIGNREEMHAALEDGEIDLAVMGRPPRTLIGNALLLGPHPHVMIAPPDHPLAGTRDAAPQAILAETFLMREPGSGTRLLAEQFLDQIGGGQGYRTLELGTNETIKQGVIAGLGLAVISGHTVVAELETGRLALVGAAGLPIQRHWFVVMPQGRPRSAACAVVAQFLTEQRDGYLPRFDWRPTGGGGG